MSNSVVPPEPTKSRGRGLPAVPGPAAAAGLAKRLTATARNVAEVVRFGGLETGEEQSPYAVVAEQLNSRLRHYSPDAAAEGAPPIVLVPPLMLTAEVWDVAPTSSAVTALQAEGLD